MPVKISHPKKYLVLFLALVLVAIAVPSFAQLPSNQRVVKDSTTTALTRIFIQAPQPPGDTTVKILAPARPKTITLNACGWGSFKLPSSAIGINEINSNRVRSIFPPAVIPDCFNNANDAIGTGFYNPATKIAYYKASNAPQSITVNPELVYSKTVKLNTCGQTAFRVPLGAIGFYGFSVGGTIDPPSTMISTQEYGVFYSIAGIPEVPVNQRTVCKRGVLYRAL